MSKPRKSQRRQSARPTPSATPAVPSEAEAPRRDAAGLPAVDAEEAALRDQLAVAAGSRNLASHDLYSRSLRITSQISRASVTA